MDVITKALSYATQNTDQLLLALQEHALLVTIPLGVSLLIGLPLGWLSSQFSTAALFFINGFNILRVIPSLAILFLSIPYLGLTIYSAITALTILVIPPILISTDVAFRRIDPFIREAAFGIGMNRSQVLRLIEIPLALPIIVAGIKTATIEVISSATLAAFIGAGGLGSFITLGFSLYDHSILLVGAIPVAMMAIFAEVGLSFLQRILLVRPLTLG